MKQKLFFIKVCQIIQPNDPACISSHPRPPPPEFQKKSLFKIGAISAVLHIWGENDSLQMFLKILYQLGETNFLRCSVYFLRPNRAFSKIFVNCHFLPIYMHIAESTPILKRKIFEIRPKMAGGGRDGRICMWNHSHG